ncbi:MAG TPA: LEA type 2 family protein [Polyangiaceae bacterium]|nr:LEA type 2 family protein [Polyangiaceae bacterium]
MERRSFLTGGVSLLLLPSCVSKPTMQLHHAEIRSAGPAGIGMQVFLSVHNDNSFDVQVRNVRVQTTMAGKWALPPVSYSPNQWLPADGTVVVQAPVIIPWGLVVPLMAETAMRDRIEYRVRGEADVTAMRSLGIRVNKHPVDETGSVPRIAILQAGRTMFPFLQ